MNNTVIVKDLDNKTLHVTREFNAPVSKLWQAWTESALLDKWWAPKPWKAQTKTMDLRAGGNWLYYMAGPNGEQSWSRMEFKEISPEDSFAADATFCDENGNRIDGFPLMHWAVKFMATKTGSKLEVTLTFDDTAGMEKLIAMGFEGGFSMGLGNLEGLLAKALGGEE